MQLVHVLLIIVSILTILSGVSLLLGSAKSERPRSAWFLIAAVGAAVWGVSISLFLSLGADATSVKVAPWLVKGIYSGAILMDVALLGYISWRYKIGKALTSIFLVTGAILLALFFYDPSVLYSSINLVNSGNSITIDFNHAFYIAYSLYFCAITPVFCGFLIHQIRHSRNKRTRSGYLWFLVGLIIAGGLSLIFDIILPPTRYELIWIGPMTISLAILCFYYAILRFRIISLSTHWLRIMSYISIIGTAVIVYLLVFHLVFSALFKIANPSFQVILLNFIMVAIVLLLTPAISELNSMTKSLIFTRQINISYIVKKIAAFNRRKVDFKDISGFLAEYMHFSFVGFLINGKFYGSDEFRLNSEEINDIISLKHPEHGMWQDISKLTTLKDLEIFRVGLLTDVSGTAVGQVVLGRPISKAKLDKKDLAEVEMIFNLITVMVENGSRNA